MRPDDLAATVYAALGIDPHTELRSAGGRPVRAADGKIVSGVLPEGFGPVIFLLFLCL